MAKNEEQNSQLKTGSGENPGITGTNKRGVIPAGAGSNVHDINANPDAESGNIDNPLAKPGVEGSGIGNKARQTRGES